MERADRLALLSRPTLRGARAGRPPPRRPRSSGSSRGASPRTRAAVAGATAAFGLLASCVLPAEAAAQTLTQDEALALAFPEADRVERRTAYLEEADLARAAELAGPDVEIESGIVTYYVAVRDGEPAGVAYFDAHRVRTLPEVLMIVVGTDDRIRRLEVVSFHEPPEYRPPDGWLRQLHDRPLDATLSLRGEIVGITGATLSANAVTAAARRVLALHEVIDPFGDPGGPEVRSAPGGVEPFAASPEAHGADP